MVESGFDRHVEAVRHFSRFYTKRIGTLREGLLGSPFSLTQARILYELAHRGETTATAIRKELGLDGGYLSRLLRGFRKNGLVEGSRSGRDGRQSDLRLTESGRETLGVLESRSRDEVAAMLEGLSREDRGRLVNTMKTVEDLLDAGGEPREPYILRPHGPGDMGWIVHRHAVLYSEEYGWDDRFEALVAEIVGEILGNFDPKAERCWIAERDGERVGSVVVVRYAERVAKLRLLLVEPKARGLGIGARLLNESLRFTRGAGYESMTLWTNSILLAARGLYERAGFHLVHEEPYHGFGHDLVGETWEKSLR
jgi:DNA-binding MarR family transcriptional regulator/GNAT superfamily N-acetyltransferase